MPYSPLDNLYVGRTATTGTPSITLNSPSNGGSSSTLTPQLEFTGITSTGNQNINYEIQVDTNSNFDSQSSATPAVVQTNSGVDGGGSGSVSVAFTSTPTTGNMLYAVFGVANTATNLVLSGFNDTAGNTWTKVYDYNDVTSGNGGGGIQIWIAGNCAGVASTISINDAGYSTGLSIGEVSGLGLYPQLDQVLTNSILGVAPTGGSTGTLSTANEFVLSATMNICGSNGGTAAYTAGTGYSNFQTQDGTFVQVATQSKIVSSTTAVSHNYAAGGKSTYYNVMALLTFSGGPLIDQFSSTPNSFSLVAHTGQGSTNTNGFTTTSINTTGANLIVVAIDYDTAPTLADSFSNVWTVAAGPVGSSGSDTVLYYCANPTVGSGHTFTITVTNGSPVIFVQAWSGGASFPLNKTNGAGGGDAGTVQPGSITPGSNGELLVSSVFNADATNNVTINDSFSISDQLLQVNSEHFGGGAAYLIQAGGGAINPTWTNPSGSNLYAAAIASFVPGYTTTTGFADITNPGDTVPYPSGDEIGYTVQSALTLNTLYYWRVRQLPFLNNVNYYAPWSSTYSFTASTGGGGGTVILPHLFSSMGLGT